MKTTEQAWQPEEEEILKRAINVFSLKRTFFQINKWRKSQELPLRTKASVARKIKRMGGEPVDKRWRQCEIEILHLYAGELPPEDIAKKVNGKRIPFGFEPRKVATVRKKMAELGLRLSPDLDNFPVATLAEYLNISEERIYRWYKECDLVVTKRSKNRIAISRKDLKAFAVAHPEKFAGIDRKALLWLFEDQAIVDLCFRPLAKTGKPKPVIRIDINAKYDSLKEAAANCFINYAAMKKKARGKERWKICGIEFMFARCGNLL